jgi:methionyl-tRNA formyltransferase
MKIVFFGSTEFSRPILESINSAFNIVGFVTTRPKPKGRGLKTKASEIAEWGKSVGLDLYMPEDPNTEDFVQKMNGLSPDILVLSAYGHILSRRLLEVGRQGSINIHPSLLPRYRGAAPIQRAIMAGDEETGVTIFFMDEKVDHGEVVAQQSIPIDRDDTYGSLSRKLSAIGAKMIVDVLQAIASGNCRTSEQKGTASYAPKLKKEELSINWQDGVLRIYNHIRALSPQPGARTGFRGKELKVIAARMGDKNLMPGRMHVENRELYIGARDGSLVLLEVKPEGKNLMSSLDFINGYRIREGEVLK